MKCITITSPMTGLPVEAYRDEIDGSINFIEPISGMMIRAAYDFEKDCYMLPRVFTTYQPLMTVEQAADYIGVSRQRVCKLIKDGRIRAVKHGLTYHPIESSVREYAESERKAGRPWTDRV